MEDKNREIITNMLNKNLSDEMIADLTGTSLAYVREVKKSKENQKK